MPDLAIIIPARDHADRVGLALRDWHAHFGDRVHFVVVVDGSSDDTPGVVLRMKAKLPHVTLLQHSIPRGFGTALRSALSEVSEPRVAILTLDYPHQPGDLDLLLKRIDEPVEIYGVTRDISAATGCRTGVETPMLWRRIGWLYRLFMRIAFGIKLQPLGGWLGLKNHTRSWWLWLTMGVPLTDVTSSLKLFRREWLAKFPIQSSDDYAHVEVMAKLTFLGAVVAEERLPPRKAIVPTLAFKDTRVVIRDARFHSAAKR